ncbi:DUF4422 domain-containing protein [Loigolactobacillus zhaoyuanensis]|uniref:DUF4422 domain-containing protein n=1 Tax=Loigolactobacillus zhaoyuanensis TaxID=2486017 RepID=UPI000F74BC12|nr:DUF4422 domain-containing protein [Loigolactobacillus zhaoyuanensis]
MNTKILVAAHKNYVMPADKALYLPVFVGKALHPDVNQTFQGDNTGDNISEKNSHYNELTAIYWAWKNLDADAIGLVHYRRYLSLTHKKDLTQILDQAQLDRLFKTADIILPKKRDYYIETNYSHYIHAHHEEPLLLTKQIIQQDYPEYSAAFDTVLYKQHSAHMFNMFIMKQQPFNEYCTWLFDILAKLENQIDITDYDTYEARVYGFISERLLDVWLECHPEYRATEVPFVFMEKQNWFKKGFTFLRRKMVPERFNGDNKR